MPLRNKPTKKKYSPKNTPIQYAEPDNEQEYAKIEKPLGNCHFLLINIAGKERTASTCGTAKKGKRMQKGQLVLIEPLSEDLDKKWQIIFKYSPGHEKILEKEGHLRKIEEIENDSDSENSDDDFQFEDQVVEQQQEANNDIDFTDIDNI
jgi:initiation factor 1A